MECDNRFYQPPIYSPKTSAELEDASADWPLICYADFTDYILVITKRDNWPLFARWFKRVESVRESFQRLYPIRLDTMHDRSIAEPDELLLLVETRRLMDAIGRRGQPK